MVGVLCLFVGCAGGVTGTLYALRLSPSLPGVGLPLLATGTVDAHDLCKEFRDDPIAADKKYANKQITISGTVQASVGGEGDVLQLRPSVSAFFDEVDRAGFDVPEGTKVVVRGEFRTGAGGDVWVKHCKFVGTPPRRDGNK